MENLTLLEKLKIVKEKCKDDAYLLSFFEDIEKEIKEDKLGKEIREMIVGLFNNRIRDPVKYLKPINF